MGMVVKFHARALAGSRAANAVNCLAVRPAVIATPESKTASHHSDGTLSRCHHFETAEALAPMSAAMASREGQSSMIDLNEVSGIEQPIRQLVLNCKANVSHDLNPAIGHNVSMDEEQTARRFLADFLGRTRAAREMRYRSGREMAEAMGWGSDRQPTYSKYESRSPLPHYLIPQFCRICGVRVEWLMTGEGPGPAWHPVPEEKKKRRPAAGNAKRRAA